MGILIVDDSNYIREYFAHILRKEGYENIFVARTAQKAFEILKNKDKEIDLILLDILLEKDDGINVCKKIKKIEEYSEIPIIMLTARTEMDWLKKAFKAGAMDYICKSVTRVEFLVRVQSALKLREEMKKRKAKEKELKKLNSRLERMVSIDGLTGLANRRLFDSVLKKEWRKCRRKKKWLSLILLDIDDFKKYNDTYGHLAGDDCLKKLGKALTELIQRPEDLIARYGGEEFAAILPETDPEGVITVSNRIRKGILDLKIEHKKSEISKYITVSLGAVSMIPEEELTEKRIKEFIDLADRSLYQAKEEGKNRTIFYNVNQGKN